MFEGIGVQWGMTLLGCVAALFIPMPFFLYKYGKSIRAKSKFAPAPDVEMDKRRDEESRAAANNESNAPMEENNDLGAAESSSSDEKKLG